MLRDIRQTVLYPAISTVLSGVVMAVIGLFAFSNEKNDVSKDLSVKYIYAAFSTDVISDTIKQISENTDTQSFIFKKMMWDNFGIKDVNANIYKIHNAGAMEAKEIFVHFSPFIRAYFLQEDRTVLIQSKSEKFTFNIPPRKSATLIILSKSHEDPGERFTVNGKEIEIKKIYGRYEFDTIKSEKEFFSENYISFYFLSFLGAIALFFTLIAIFIALLTKGNVAYKVKSANDKLLTEGLTIINCIRNDDYDRYKNIIRNSEKLFNRWKSPPSE